ncbi:MAG: hypothetical protein ACXADY_20620 [Candidatus Hodarchaeales archaeon]|jgi:hypothetical protein
MDPSKAMALKKETGKPIYDYLEKKQKELGVDLVSRKWILLGAELLKGGEWLRD